VPTPSEANSPVLLQEARRVVDAESERFGGLQTRVSALLAAVVVLIGLTITVESQFNDRDIPRVVSLAVALAALAGQLACARALVLALAPRQIDTGAPQTVQFLSEAGLIEADPERLTKQLMGNLGHELDIAREDTIWTQAQIRLAARRLWAGVLGLVGLIVLFGASTSTSSVQNIKLLGTVKTHTSAPVTIRINTPIHAAISGQLHATITAPVTVIRPDHNHWNDDRLWHAEH
jgi:hypothetical protein